MSSTNRTVIAPKYFKANSIIDFLNDCEFIYHLVGRKEDDFFLNLNKVKKCEMIGVLLVYKIMEFSIKNNCFNQPLYHMNYTFMKAMKKYGFDRLIMSYLKEKESTEKELKNLQISVSDNFIIAPQALLRNDRYTSDLLNKRYLPQIERYYKSDPKVVKMIFNCFSEILLNFWEHAVDDTQSIIVAYGNKSNIEIACADNGEGIISTLSSAGKEKKDKISTFMAAIEKGITSKDLSNHMGYGLWIIDEIVNKVNGRFHLYSEGYYYQNEFNKTYYGKCGFWKGTVVYLSIPLKKPITLSDIKEINSFNNTSLKINWT